MVHRSTTGILTAALCMTLSAARSQTPADVGSLQEIMRARVNPAAAAVWEASSSVSNSAGFIDHSPTSPAEWAAVEAQARALIDAAALLLRPDLPIVEPGARLQDADLPDNRSPAQIRAAIDANPQRFARLVRRLQNSVQPTLAAIRNKDADALVIAGSDIDEACDACHRVFWYPSQ